MAEQFAAQQAAAVPAAVQVAGHAVPLVPHREPARTRCRRTTSGSSRSSGGGRAGGGQAGEELGLEVAVRGKLEPLRGKLAGRGWLRKLPDGRFTTRL